MLLSDLQLGSRLSVAFLGASCPAPSSSLSGVVNAPCHMASSQQVLEAASQDAVGANDIYNLLKPRTVQSSRGMKDLEALKLVSHEAGRLLPVNSDPYFAQL